MKAPKRISLFAVVWLLIICMTVPAWADGAAAVETQTETAPTLYFNLDFEDMNVGAVASGTYVGTGSTLWLGNNQNIAVEADGNKVLRSDKGAGATKADNPDHCLYPLKAMNAATLNAYGKDFVVSWDLFVSADDGAAFNLVAARSPNSSRKWAPSVYLNKAGTDGTATLNYTDATGTNKNTEGTVAYGQWNRIAIIVHPAEGDSQIASYDIYVNGALLAEGVKAWFDTDRFTIGKLCGNDTTAAACYQMIDNIRCYSGNTLYRAYESRRSDSIKVIGSQEKLDDSSWSVRFVSTVDGLSYEKAGYKIKATGTNVDKEWNVSSTTVYSAIYQTVNGIDSRVDAPEDCYFHVATVKNISIEKYDQITFSVTPYLLDGNGCELIGMTETFVYCDGVLVVEE